MIEMMTNYIAVKRDEPKEQTSGGLFLSRKEDQWMGTVRHVGPGPRDEKTGEFQPMDVKPGDRILFMRHGTDTLHEGGEKLDLMRIDKVLAIIEDSPCNTPADIAA